MIVDINGELFVVTEQQFNRVKEYYATKDSEDTDYEEDKNQLNEKMGLKIIESRGNDGFSVYRCLRDKNEEFGVGCLLEDRRISKNHLKLLREAALRNFLIFSYFDFGLNKHRDDQGADIDIICGNEFIQMIKKHLNIDIA